jgi:hypothetical protein
VNRFSSFQQTRQETGEQLLRVKLNVTGFCKNAGGFVTAGPQNDE